MGFPKPRKVGAAHKAASTVIPPGGVITASNINSTNAMGGTKSGVSAGVYSKAHNTNQQV